MDKYREQIWQRGDAQRIIKEARKRFTATSKNDLPGAYIALGSIHYSLVKRYRGHLMVIAMWYAWRAARNVKTALHVGGTSTLSTDQADVVTTILAKVPAPLGGNRQNAKNLLIRTLAPRDQQMKPHTLALMLCTLGRLHQEDGETSQAKSCFREADELIPAIERSQEPDRIQQMVRVQKHVGFFYHDHGDESDQEEGMFMIRELLSSPSIPRDQRLEIEAGAKERGMIIS